MTGIGTVTSDEVHLWLIEPQAVNANPPAQANSKPSDQLPAVLPEEMTAIGNVQILSEQLTGTIDRLEVRFDRAAEASSMPGENRGGAGSPPQTEKAWPGNANRTYDIQGRQYFLNVSASFDDFGF